MTNRRTILSLAALSLPVTAQPPALQLSAYRYVRTIENGTTQFGVQLYLNTPDPEVRAYEVLVRWIPSGMPGLGEWKQVSLLGVRHNFGTATLLQAETGPVQQLEVQAWTLKRAQTAQQIL